MLQKIITPEKDPILSLSTEYQADPRQNKVDLGIGVYRNEMGVTPIMQTVHRVAKSITSAQRTKVYVGLAGNEIFNQSMIDLLLKNTTAYSRVAAIQTPGASGALRMIADLIKSTEPDATIWLSDPSYVNHQPIMKAAGLNVKYYRYFNAMTKQVDTEGMIEDLSKAGPKDVVLFHGCCHNPTGADMTLFDWITITELAVKNGFLPFIDLAYHGLGHGVEADIAGLRFMAEQVPQMFIATSCSKNFGLYRERTGAAMVIASSLDIAMKAKAKLLQIVRTSYTMPPDHGAAIVAHILSDKALSAAWQKELDVMRQRLHNIRRVLCLTLREETQSEAFDFIRDHKGMFSMIGFNREQMHRLKSEHAIYAVSDGRINIAGILEAQIPQIAQSLAFIAKS